ncbi:MAG TPA: PLD nuclease N-terminal domain-containing protein [Candidatus Angelobacter sp.]|nr:PLD nuclease N-terminal domain-containing protein [Candidatus Angelobacter sp.]
MHPVFEPLLGFLILAPVSLLGALEVIFQIWMLIDAIQNPRLEGSQRVVWVLVIILMPCLGPLLYFLVGRKK